jgi:DNA-binding MarR family transcriptional regulator
LAERVDVMKQIHGELNLFARRVRVLVRRLHPDLSFVAYMMISHISGSGGCRAADLVQVYALDKSTVSRQVGDLVRRGLVARDPDSRRLHVTGEGDRLLADAAHRQLAVLDDRVSDWTDDELAAFARLLRRFNDVPQAGSE